MSIDTLEYVKTLESAGVERKVAEAHVRAMNQHVLAEIATRNDIEQMEQRLEHNGLQQVPVQSLLAIQRIEATVWKAAFAVLGGGLAIGGFLFRFVR
jgi:hypothetical protein